MQEPIMRSARRSGGASAIQTPQSPVHPMTDGPSDSILAPSDRWSLPRVGRAGESNRWGYLGAASDPGSPESSPEVSE